MSQNIHDNFFTVNMTGGTSKCFEILAIVEDQLLGKGPDFVELSGTVENDEKFSLWNCKDLINAVKETSIRYVSPNGLQSISRLWLYFEYFAKVGDQILGFGDPILLREKFPIVNINPQVNQIIGGASRPYVRPDDPTQFHKNIGLLSEQNPLTPLCHGLVEGEPSRNSQGLNVFFPKYKSPITMPIEYFEYFDESDFEPKATNVQPKADNHPAKPKKRLNYNPGDANPMPGQRQYKKGQEPRT
jgi:hypothetical protein